MSAFMPLDGFRYDEPALVLFSGGQDSTTCLGWALSRFSRVETIGFNYGQRHEAELCCRERIRSKIAADFSDWRDRLGPDHMIDMQSLSDVADCALTDHRRIEMEANGLPNTFVPGRNLLFFTFAAALAYRRGIRVLVGGMCETDFSGYPDCRDDALKSLQATLSLGMGSPFVVETPLMRLTKARTWALAEAVGGPRFVELVRCETHTCYMGDHEHLHDWGYGCGRCPACELRRRGWECWRAEDGKD